MEKMEMKLFENIGWWVEAPRYRRKDWGKLFVVGLALVSPERSKAGYDNFRFMRDVKKGDICLHLNKSKQIAGISRAIASHMPTPFEVEGSSGLYVPLSGFHPLKPPLNVLMDEYRERLDQLREAAKREEMFYFYTKDLALNMYLTPISQGLLDFLDDVYSEAAGVTISEIVCMLEQGKV